MTTQTLPAKASGEFLIGGSLPGKARGSGGRSGGPRTCASRRR